MGLVTGWLLGGKQASYDAFTASAVLAAIGALVTASSTVGTGDAGVTFVAAGLASYLAHHSVRVLLGGGRPS